MSDKNIDKDIEILKEHIKELDEEKVLYGGFLSRKQAIENVLSEIEELKDDLRKHEETSFDFQKENIELREEIKERHIKHIALAIENEDLNKELETYKKIAEKLATELRQADNGAEQLGYYGEFANKPTQCIIDWARKEVEKDEIYNK